MFAAELLIDRALARDETCVYELCVELPQPSTETRFDHYASRRLGELLVWVRFVLRAPAGTRGAVQP